MRHVFTQEERLRGGQNRMKREDAQQHQEHAYQMLQLKNPGVAMWIYEQKVKPHMQRKQTAKQARERAAMQQTVLADHQGRRKPMR